MARSVLVRTPADGPREQRATGKPPGFSSWLKSSWTEGCRAWSTIRITMSFICLGRSFCYERQEITRRGRNEEVILCRDFVDRAAFSTCGEKQAVRSVLLVDIGGRGNGS